MCRIIATLLARLAPSRQVEQQLIWEYSQVKDGQVQVTSPTPDIRVKNPVVMSNAPRFLMRP